MTALEYSHHLPMTSSAPMCQLETIISQLIKESDQALQQVAELRAEVQCLTNEKRILDQKLQWYENPHVPPSVTTLTGTTEKKNCQPQTKQLSHEKRSSQKSAVRPLNGPEFLVHMGSVPTDIIVTPVDQLGDTDNIPPGAAVLITRLLTVAKTVFGEESITSNVAEVFNSQHDRKNRYAGRKALDHARKDLRAWLALKFYPKGAWLILQRHEWKVNYRLLRDAGLLTVSQLGVH